VKSLVLAKADRTKPRRWWRKGVRRTLDSRNRYPVRVARLEKIEACEFRIGEGHVGGAKVRIFAFCAEMSLQVLP
jgi:hypothetical protein